MQVATYHLILDVDFDSMAFSGRQAISLNEVDGSLALDSFDLAIKNVKADGTSVPFAIDKGEHKLKIETRNGTKLVEIEYEGKASRESLHGFYKSSYSSGYLLTTDLEPIGARRVFPCIDNPSYKAVYKLEVITNKDLTVLFNTPVQRKEDLQNGKSKFVFEPTPRMSSYLFYLGIGKFDEISLKDKEVEFIAATAPGQAQRGKYGLENAVKFLRSYEEYFGVKYPLKKLHLIAIPEYPSGAMENWGAITFREIALLVDQNTSVASRRRAVEVIGHEIAHMWFGDLVTMKWWNDLWLNESFATFMESKMTDKLYPEWNIWSDFLLQLTADAMNGDALSHTHPIEVEVRSPEEVSQIFDEISYGKGGSTLRMIEAYVGDEAFRVGVSKYLKNFSYSNAEGRNLWKSIEEASNTPVEDLMEAWVKKPGYPLVRASLNEGKIKLEQERFFLSGKVSKEEIWPIPLVASINGKEKRVLLQGKQGELEVDGTLDQLKINHGQTGFYRVLYDEYLYSIIKKEFLSLAPFDKWGIITDLFAFLEAGLSKPDVYFDIVEICKKESEYIVVDAIADQLRFLKLVSNNPRVSRGFFDFYRSQMERLGVEKRQGEKDTDAILRGKIANSLAIHDEEFARKMSSKFSEYENVDPNIRNAVAVAYARTNGEAAFEKLVSTIKKMDNESDTIKLFNGLVSFKNPELVRKSLDLSLGGDFNRADAIYTIMASSTFPESRSEVWEWIAKNVDKIKETFAGTYILSSILQEVIPILGLGREVQVKSYFASKKLEEASTGVNKGLEMLDIYSKLVAVLTS